MSYTVSYKHPHFADGVEFGVAGLGTIPNGGSIEVDADLERNFIAIRGMTLEDALAGDSMLEVSGSSELDADEVNQLLPPPEIVAEELDSMKKDELLGLAAAVPGVEVSPGMKKDEIKDALVQRSEMGGEQ